MQGVPVVVAWRCSDGWARRAVRPSRRGDEPAQGLADGGTACPVAICRPVGAGRGGRRDGVPWRDLSACLHELPFDLHGVVMNRRRA